MSAAESERVGVLVVDDRPDDARALRGILARADYDVVCVGSGEEALEQLSNREFAVILLDVLIPGMSDFETARLIRRREASSAVPIIFLTAGAASEELVRRGYSAGAVDYLPKPVDPNIVRAKVAVFADLFKKTQLIRRKQEKLRAVEQRSSERALRASEVLYEATFDQAPVGIGHAATDGRWLRVNRKLCEIFGYGEHEVASMRLQDLVHPDEASETLAALSQLIEGHLETHRREVRCVDRHGRAVWVIVALSLLRGASRKQSQFIAVVEDVTERKLAADRQRVLAQVSEHLLRSLDARDTLSEVAASIVPAMADWCAILTGGDHGASESAVRHTDPAKAEIARELDRRLSLDDSSVVEGALRTGPRLLSSGCGEGRIAFSSDPQLQAMAEALGLDSLVVVPLWSRRRRLGALMLAASSGGRRHGQADLVAAEELGNRLVLALENARLYQTAQQAIGMRDEFLSIASHELRTPLTPLQITLQRLLRTRSRGSLEQVETERLRSLLARGERQVGRLTALVETLLDVSRISSGRMPLRREPLDLSKVARDVVARFADEVARAGCRPELKLDPSVRGCWDRQRIEQALGNLLGNALKYGPGKPIQIEVSRAGRNARLSVRDQGIGIEPSSLGRIFERFERAVPSSSYGGLGLGLYITKQIVEAHGGSIRVVSELGGGSSFVLEIPAEAMELTTRSSGTALEEMGQDGTDARAR